MKSDLIPDLTEELEHPKPQQNPNPAVPAPEPQHEWVQVNS